MKRAWRAMRSAKAAGRLRRPQVFLFSLAVALLMDDKPDSFLHQCLSNALRRFETNLDGALPRTAPYLRRLLRGVPTRPDHFLAVRNFPHFLLPYWLSPVADRVADAGFQTDLIYSSLNGYYAIRLCDNIADNDSPPELRKLAPCTLYFDSEAIAPYSRLFPAKHEFWDLFDKFLAQQSEASAADGLLEDVDPATFASLSSRKFTGAKIPIAAVRYRYPGLERSFEQWLDFVDCLGSFAQFSNDFFDWRHDSTHGITTYVSSEAKRRAPEEGITSWFLREGFDWGAGELQSRFDNVKLQGEELGNEAVLHWAAERGRTLQEDIEKLDSALELLRTLHRIISGNRP
jgi:hypothetical protein